jgi:aspartate racemase
VKIIGLIGGMSWESTVPYYRQINETVKAELGGLHSARIVLYSLDFHEVERLQHAGDWEAAGALLAAAARALEAAGADVLVLCTNTMHKVAPAIEAAVRLPLLHIADPTAEAIRAAGVSRVGLLGTRFTMEQPFYRDRLRDRFGLEVLVPSEPVIGQQVQQRCHHCTHLIARTCLPDQDSEDTKTLGFIIFDH